LKFANEIVRNQRSRSTDDYGSGQFGAPRKRKHGREPHAGLDIQARPGEEVFSPIKGEIVREGFPYGDDLSFRYVVIRGVDKWSNYKIRLFYVEGLFSGKVAPGAIVGRAQNLILRYPMITNHIHLEVSFHDRLLSPFEIYGQCF